MPKQYGGYQAPKKKTKPGTIIGNHGIMGGNGGVVTWSLSEQDLKDELDYTIPKGYDLPNEGLICKLPTNLQRYIKGAEPINILTLLARLIVEKDFGKQSEIIEKERDVKQMAYEILEYYGKETERD